ncbi:conserved hypothetical protein [Tenacibaculum sediminilitoris]|uniref:hypothetical protein n=1 Tax=Tenacibaculum sediminilitoris TaxID=1820334 RepID=UPI003893F922
MMLASKIKNNGFTAFLVLLTLVIGFLSYQNASDYSKLKTVFELKKGGLTNIFKDPKEASYKKSEYSLKLKR